MSDQRNLIFPEKNAHYEASLMAVVFVGQDGNKAIRCAISSEALEDHFNGDRKNLLSVFQKNRENIEHKARRKYLAENLELNGSILLKTEDIK